MYRKVLVGGLTTAAILGAGGTALALTGPGTPSNGSTTSTTGSAHGASHHGKGRARLLKRLSHAQIVTRGGKGKGFVTHDLIRGTVTSVSSSAISVQAADKTTETFVVNDKTKVRVRTSGHGSAASIGQVAKGDQVLVAGTGTSTLTAKHIVDVKK